MYGALKFLRIVGSGDPLKKEEAMDFKALGDTREEDDLQAESSSYRFTFWNVYVYVYICVYS